MVEYKGRPAVEKLAHDLGAASDFLNYINQSRHGVKLPRPDPRSPKPGGELAIGKNMSRSEWAQDIAEKAWVNKHENDLGVISYYDKFLGIFEMTASEKLGRAGRNWYRPEVSRSSAEFLLDTFKRARSVGLAIHSFAPQLENQLPTNQFMKVK